MAFLNAQNKFRNFGSLIEINGKAYTGNVFYVDSGHALATDDTSHGTMDQPFATIDYAIGRCAANNSDLIMVSSGHAETVTAAITLDIAGVSIVGIGLGRARPAITANFASAGDTINVTAANCYIENLRLVASSASQNAQINIAAGDFIANNCIIEQGANNLIGVTVPAAGDRFEFHNCRWIGTAANPDICIDLEAKNAGQDFVIKDCSANFSASAGLDLAFIRNTEDTTIGGTIDGLTVIGCDATVVDFNSSLSAIGEGILHRIRFVASTGITIANALDVGGYGIVDCMGTDSAAARASLIPTTTPN